MPLKTNPIYIRTRLFSIKIEGCTIDEFIDLSNSLKTTLPSLNLWLARYNIYLGPDKLDKTNNVTNLSASEIKEMFLYSDYDGPNPFNRKDDKDNNGDVVAS